MDAQRCRGMSRDDGWINGLKPSVATPNRLRQALGVVWCFGLALGSLGRCAGILGTTAPTLEKRHGGGACALLNSGGKGGGMLAPVLAPRIGEHYGWTTSTQAYEAYALTGCPKVLPDGEA